MPDEGVYNEVNMNRRVGVILVVVIIFTVGSFSLNTLLYNEKQADEATTKIENTMNNASESAKVTPISHATFVLEINGQTIFNDPVGDASSFTNFGEPNIILISDIHEDHMDAGTVQTLATERTTIIMPQAVADKLPDTIPGKKLILRNGENTNQNGITITAVPMYNVPESENSFHTKGRGNGYILEANGERIYIAGDTGPTSEMKALSGIDTAFIPMNLSYTMNTEEAADAVLSFKPKKVIPYHYRGENGLSDINRFKELVNDSDPNIEVSLLNFYPEE